MVGGVVRFNNILDAAVIASSKSNITGCTLGYRVSDYSPLDVIVASSSQVAQSLTQWYFVSIIALTIAVTLASLKALLDLEGELLAYTISRILEPEIAERLDLQEYVPPPTLGELQRIALKLGYKIKTKTIQASTRGATAILTTLLVENRKTLEVVEKARSRGDTTIIVTPRKPWRDMGSLEQAYIAYTTYTKTAAKIKNMGAELYTCCPLTTLE
jgi:hypothetical protein